ncbi:hypothetical protein PRtIB026_A04560 [Pseudomonas sp. RtIB026]|nr:hypothetical protein PRtIB026_A04560 [Pseudomonas sp. RtIB026]
MYVRLKHMTLHFFKYASKINTAKKTDDAELLRKTVIDSIIICLASANTLRIFLDDYHQSSAKNITDLCLELSSHKTQADSAAVYSEILESLLTHGGKMAKIMESTDHMEAGNPRVEMSTLVPLLTFDLLKHVTTLDIQLEAAMEKRFHAIETNFTL